MSEIKSGKTITWEVYFEILNISKVTHPKGGVC